MAPINEKKKWGRALVTNQEFELLFQGFDTGHRYRGCPYILSAEIMHQMKGQIEHLSWFSRNCSISINKRILGLEQKRIQVINRERIESMSVAKAQDQGHGC